MDEVKDDEEDAEETPDEDAGAKKRKACSPLYCLSATCLHCYLFSAPLLNPRRTNQLLKRPRLPVPESRRAKPQLKMRTMKIKDASKLNNNCSIDKDIPCVTSDHLAAPVPNYRAVSSFYLTFLDLTQFLASCLLTYTRYSLSLLLYCRIC